MNNVNTPSIVSKRRNRIKPSEQSGLISVGWGRRDWVSHAWCRDGERSRSSTWDALVTAAAMQLLRWQARDNAYNTVFIRQSSEIQLKNYEIYMGVELRLNALAQQYSNIYWLLHIPNHKITFPSQTRREIHNSLKLNLRVKTTLEQQVIIKLRRVIDKLWCWALNGICLVSW